MTAAPHRIVVLAPVFHGYSAALGAALERRGHQVTVWHYDERPKFVQKVRGKLLDELPQRLGLRDPLNQQRLNVTKQAIDLVGAVRPDVVLGIKADLIGPEFWQHARRGGALTHLWLYDEVRRSCHDPDSYRAVDVLTTYSRGDQELLRAQGQATSYVPNAFDASLADVPPVSVPAFLFVGARYGFREQVLQSLAADGLPVLAVGREWSHHPIDRLRTWDLRRPPIPALRDHARSESYGLMAGALGNLNVHHDQDGFTMRTFEIPGMAGVQLIDRSDVSEFYDIGTEVLTYASTEELLEHAHRLQRDQRWAQEIGRRGRQRTLAEHTFDHRVADLEDLWR